MTERHVTAVCSDDSCEFSLTAPYRVHDDIQVMLAKAEDHARTGWGHWVDVEGVNFSVTVDGR